MTLTEISIKRPILIIVFFLIISLLGIFAIGQLKYELLPKINAPFVSVIAVYEGASPAEIESTVTKKIEDAVAGASKVKRITSRSNEGYAVISIEFLQDTDLDKAMQEVQRFVNQVVPQLPQGAKTPTVDKFSLADLPVLRLAGTSNLSEKELYQILKEQIKPRLSQLKGVGRIQLVGGEEKEIKVYLDEQKIKYHQIPMLTMVQALQKSNLDVPIGNIKDEDAQFGLRLNGKISEFETLENLDIAVLKDGSKIKLKDIATLEDGSKDGKTITRLNQKNAIGLIVQKQSNANAVEVSELVRSEIEKIETEYKTQKLTFEIAADSSEFTLKATETVFHDLIIAVFLVALVMLVFLHSLRNALIVMIAIPSSLVFSFIGMYIMDFSLNLMTLLAMSLVIGILVDDSIVVLENIYRHLEMGKDKVKASLDGRNEIGFSALSITLVDVVVFLPLAFVPGITGGLVKEFALVIVVSTLASLIVSFTLTPMLASRFAKLEHLSPKNIFGRIILTIEKQIHKLTSFYVSFLKKGLKFRWVVYFIAFGSMIASFSLVTEGYIGGEFVPTTDKGEISVIVETPAGTKFEETQRVAQKFEKKIQNLPEVKRIFSTVGLSNDPYFGEMIGDNQIEFSILLTDKKERTKTVLQISQQIRNMILEEAGTKVKVSPVGVIGAEATPIQILISGADRKQMFEYAQKLKKLTSEIKGTDDVRLSVLAGKPELDIQINRDRLASLGLNLDEVATALRVALTGFDDLKFREGNTEFPLRVQLEKSDRNKTEQIENLSFINAQGELVYLKQIADIQMITSASALERRNKNASVTMFSKAIGKSVNEIGEEIKQIVAQNPPPAGIKISYEGDLEMADDSFVYLGLAIIAGITFVYLIMVALYNSFLYPFVVLFSIPVALTGALLALALTMKTLNVFSIFGMIMMLGLVAKNAILIVDRANELRKEGRNVLYALLDAGKTRLRPILMTTLAMVIGMLPLALQTGSGGEYNSALAWVLIGGLTSSMIFTLFIVPAIYLELDRILKRFSKKNIMNTPKNILEKAVVTGLLMIFTTINGYSQTTLSLKEAESKLRSNNIELNIQKKDIQKSEYAVKEAQSIYLPSLNLSGNYNRNIRPQVFFLPATFFDPTADSKEFRSVNASAKNVYQANLTLSVPLLQFENKPILENAQLNKENAQLTVRTLENQKLAELRKIYFDALWAKAQHDFWIENLKRQSRILSDVRQRLEQGFLTEADTLQAYVQVENLKPNLIKAKNAYTLAENQLKLLLNLPSQEVLQFSDSLCFNSKNIVFSNLETKKRTDLEQLNIQKKILDNQTKIEKAKLMPNLQLIGQHSILTQHENFDFDKYRWVNSTFVGLQLNVPLFNGFRQNNKMAQIKLESEQTSERYNFAVKQINLEIQTLQNTLQETSLQLQTQEKVLKAAQRSYNLMYDRWKKGIVKQGDLIDSEMVLQQAKLNHIGLVYNCLLIEIELKKAQGE
ncbi:MAG: efflux RND transporter permease subunit [Raineya sp.]|jgi:hydrophobe/amphiphile efflux-1 (HAE1) family protein|nr:efflux RND transporter permease subunit [Raineya sp.]